jgi:hypothetical protein
VVVRFKNVEFVKNAADMPDTQWTYKTVNGKEMKMDVFLVEHGLLIGEHRVVRPDGVESLQPAEFDTYR